MRGTVMGARMSTDGHVSFPDQEIYGIATVRILRNCEVIGRALDTPRHISIAAISLGFKPGDSVIVAHRDGSCRTVKLAP